MRNKIIAILLVTMTLLVGCGESKHFNTAGQPDWDYYNNNTTDGHVYYAMSKDSFYSDGSWESNQMFNHWYKNYMKMRQEECTYDRD